MKEKGYSLSKHTLTKLLQDLGYSLQGKGQVFSHQDTAIWCRKLNNKYNLRQFNKP